MILPILLAAYAADPVIETPLTDPEPPAKQTIFSYPDSDDDGILDIEDKCRTLEETRNQFADDDGCPDYRDQIALVASYEGEVIEAESYLIRGGGIDVASTLPPTVSVLPNATVTVAAVRECLEGEATVALEEDGVLRLELQPVWNHRVHMEVRGPDGALVPNAVVSTVASSTPGCAPETVGIPGGQGDLMLGEGDHVVRIEAPGLVTTNRILHLHDASLPLLLSVALDPPTDVRADLARVHFATDESTLTPEARLILDDVASYLVEHQDHVRRLVLEGHADERASNAYNHDLSFDRAHAVQDYLASQGVPANRIELIAEGETDPLVAADGPNAWAANRRVEVELEEAAVVDAATIDTVPSVPRVD